MSPRTVTQTQEITGIGDQSPKKLIKTTTTVIPDPIDQPNPQKAYIAKKALFRTYKTLFYILGIIEVILGFRILLKLIGANPASGFTSLVYSISGPFVKPFFGVVSSTATGSSILEWSTIIAMAVYTVIVWLIVEFFQIVKPVKQEEIEQTVDNL